MDEVFSTDYSYSDRKENVYTAGGCWGVWWCEEEGETHEQVGGGGGQDRKLELST